MNGRQYFVSDEVTECLDGRFDKAVEFVHDREREDDANMEIAYDLSKSYSIQKLDEVAITDILEELFQSPVYESFTDDDRSNVLRYASRIISHGMDELDDKSVALKWTIKGGTESDGHLFPVESTIRKVSTAPIDIALLTGWGGLDVLKASGYDADDYQDYGCSSRLQFLQLLGALSSQRVQNHIASSEAVRNVPKGGVTRRILFGGDLNFDFYMGTKERYPNGSNDPIGLPQDFAPDNCHEKFIHSYHSVEEDVFINLLFWLNELSLSSMEKSQFDFVQDATFRAIESVGEIRRGSFSMGSAQHYDTEVISMVSDFRKYFNDPLVLEDGSKTLVTAQIPGGLMSDSFTDVNVEANNELSLRTCIWQNGEKKELQRLTFDDSELEPLIELSIEHAYRGLGRTSLIRLISIIALRFFPEECGVGQPRGYYEQRKRLPRLAAQLVLGIDPESKGDS